MWLRPLAVRASFYFTCKSSLCVPATDRCWTELACVLCMSEGRGRVVWMARTWVEITLAWTQETKIFEFCVASVQTLNSALHCLCTGFWLRSVFSCWKRQVGIQSCWQMWKYLWLYLKLLVKCPFYYRAGDIFSQLLFIRLYKATMNFFSVEKNQQFSRFTLDLNQKSNTVLGAE